MNESGHRVAVTPPAICRSPLLKTELERSFPQAIYNEKGRYLSESELIGFFRDCEAVIVGRDPVNETLLKALPGLKVVAKYGVGLDNVDEKALARHGVALGWTAGVNKRCVAELTLCFILGLPHNVFPTGWKLKRGLWNKDGGRQLLEKTVGIVGCGNVGQEVVRLLRPFGCRVLVNDILDKNEFCRGEGARPAGFEELVRTADIISLHVPLTGQTRRMVDAGVLRNMKSSAFLVNTSRGEVVCQESLKSALKTGGIAGAALDVFAGEPPDDAEFLALENLMVTPHIGGNAREAVEAMGRSAIGHLVRYFKE